MTDDDRKKALQAKLRAALRTPVVIKPMPLATPTVGDGVPILPPVPPEQRPEHDQRGRLLGGRRRNGIA